MGMTMTAKIMAAHSGRSSVSQGELIVSKVDMGLANDITAPVAIAELKKAGITEVFDRSKIALVMDHFTPNKDVKSAEQCCVVRNFARDMDIQHFFDVGEMGIEHALLPEKGLVAPGEVVIGADSHTCTYGALGAFSTGVGSTDLAAVMATGECWLKVPGALKFVLHGKPSKWVGGKDLILHIIGMIGVDGALYRSMEFAGNGVAHLTMDDRFTVCNMAIEAGGKNGIFPVDARTLEYVKGRVSREFKAFEADTDAPYERVYEIDLSALKPTVAFPHLPSNTKTVDEAGNVEIQQAVIGSCTNGRIEDLRIAAEVLRGRRVSRNVRTIVIPATQSIYLQAMKEGLLETFINAGAAVSTPTCGPCIGGHMGVLAKGERAVATTNRNFVGRMGHVESEIYLARVKAGDVMVGGRNFGCGSSREHAPLSIKGAGISCVIAESFARIFYRNSINIGLPIMECEAAAKAIQEGDEVEAEFDTGVIRNLTTGETYTAQPFPDFIKNIIRHGGLLNAIRAQKQ